MKKLMVVLLGLLFISSTAFSQGIRNGLFNSRSISKANPTSSENENFSIFSLGTMFGVSYSLTDMTTYKVRDNIVVTDRTGTGLDRVLPSVYAFPSINLFGVPGKSLSMIVPVNLNPSADLALGLGLSYGFNTFKETAEVGIALTAIWSDRFQLNDAQQNSFLNKTPLPSGESSEFSKYKTMSVGLGIYIIPLLK